MGGKTSQLQIRVSPEQKRELKRLAGSAGVSVSKYVLAAALPASSRAAQERIDALSGHDDRCKALSRWRVYLEGLSGDDWIAQLEDLTVTGLAPALRNYAAAMVELVALERGLSVPAWVAHVEPLENPHFSWDLRSLRPHLMRITPLTFKRRNVFVDADEREGRALRGA